jgi:hypothetical protein
MGSLKRALFLGLAVLAIQGTRVSAIQNDGRVEGSVTDQSGGVLPGATVVAASLDGRVLGSVTTDSAGRYTIHDLPASPVTLTFQLDGFSPAAVRVDVAAGANVQPTRQLTVAPRAESVTVYGHVQPPAPALPRVAPPPPAPIIEPLPEHDRESVCGPAKLVAPVEDAASIRARLHGAENGFYVQGDQVVIGAGTAEGLRTGSNYAARRPYRVRPSDVVPIAEHTAGVVQIVSAQEHEATAVVVYACDELMKGDTLGEFRPEPLRPAESGGTPAFHDATRVLFADQGQLIGVPRRLMVIDRGSNGGIRAGQRMTLFRRRHSAAGAPSVIGEAVVVAVREDSATIRIEHATDVIDFGDWAAPQRTAAGPVRRSR